MSYEDVVSALRRIANNPNTPAWIKTQIEEALRDVADVIEEKDVRLSG